MSNSSSDNTFKSCELISHLMKKHGRSINPDIISMTLNQNDTDVFIKIISKDQNSSNVTEKTNLNLIADQGVDNLIFLPVKSLTENVKSFLELDKFDLFMISRRIFFKGISSNC